MAVILQTFLYAFLWKSLKENINLLIKISMKLVAKGSIKKLVSNGSDTE